MGTRIGSNVIGQPRTVDRRRISTGRVRHQIRICQDTGIPLHRWGGRIVVPGNGPIPKGGIGYRASRDGVRRRDTETWIEHDLNVGKALEITVEDAPCESVIAG